MAILYRIFWVQIQLVFLQTLQSQHLSSCVHCRRLSPGQSKDTSPMCRFFTIGIHSLIPCSHSLDTITSSQILIYLLPISLSFSLVMLCWLYIFQHDGCSLCFQFLFLIQKSAKCSGSPVPLQCGEAEPVRDFFEMHHQALFLGNEHSSVFAFHGSISSWEVFVLVFFFFLSLCDFLAQ